MLVLIHLRLSLSQDCPKGKAYYCFLLDGMRTA